MPAGTCTISGQTLTCHAKTVSRQHHDSDKKTGASELPLAERKGWKREQAQKARAALNRVLTIKGELCFNKEFIQWLLRTRGYQRREEFNGTTRAASGNEKEEGSHARALQLGLERQRSILSLAGRLSVRLGYDGRRVLEEAAGQEGKGQEDGHDEEERVPIADPLDRACAGLESSV